MSKKLLLSIFVTVCAIVAIFTFLYYRNNNGIESQIIAMQGQHINLNFRDAGMKYNGVDSAFVSLEEPKMVVFVDSLSCSGCFLSHLAGYYEINDSLRTHNASMLVILHPMQEKISELESRLENEKYPFWCILDKKGEFINNNPDFPDNRYLHTFLLDKEDNIKIFGDPTFSSKISELMISVL